MEEFKKIDITDFEAFIERNEELDKVEREIVDFTDFSNFEAFISLEEKRTQIMHSLGYGEDDTIDAPLPPLPLPKKKNKRKLIKEKNAIKKVNKTLDSDNLSVDSLGLIRKDIELLDKYRRGAIEEYEDEEVRGDIETIYSKIEGLLGEKVA